MNGHLSSKQIDRYLIGEVARAEAQHAHECAGCAAEIAGMERSLALFRQTVRQWSEHAAGAAGEPVWSAPQMFQFPPTQEAGLLAGGATRAGVSSFLLHAAAFAMALTLGLKPDVSDTLRMMGPEVPIYFPKPVADRSGGGGGGAREPLEARKGSPPKAAPKQFAPPRVDPVEAQLMMPPSIVIPADIAELSASRYGDPFANADNLSNGIGSGAGIGNGDGGGVGPGRGPGLGPGMNGGVGGGVDGGGVYRLGGGVLAPRLVKKIEPEYSEEARKAKWHGTVVMSVVVDEKGRPRDIRVLRRLGLGLDEKAIDAVQRWEFKPGTLNGKPVAVQAVVEVNFRLL